MDKQLHEALSGAMDQNGTVISTAMAELILGIFEQLLHQRLMTLDDAAHIVGRARTRIAQSDIREGREGAFVATTETLHLMLDQIHAAS
jgi:hypothetical protein